MALTLAQLAERMQQIDTCLLCTRTGEGMAARPMSNNKDVEWDATSWFFTNADTDLVAQIRSCPEAMVTCSGDGLWVQVSGRARLHAVEQDGARDLMQQHWDPDVERWFEQGLDTPGLILVEVRPRTVRYWSFADGDGVITV